MDANVVEQIMDLGFDVYMRHPEDMWLYYTDGTQIGYLQDDRGMGFSIFSVHKPNTTTGIGFHVKSNIEKIDETTLKAGFIHTPAWATSRDHKSVRKFKDIKEFLNYSDWNKSYQLIKN